ncbi:MAG TPA: EAL domain-containing protein [Vicinamibacterales bacterium]|nr:EAL domain-containing protein [Vicinamibacterales bacterium]
MNDGFVMRDPRATPVRPEADADVGPAASSRASRQLHAAALASQLESIAAGDVFAAVQEIVVLAAEAIGCERVNAWLFNEDETELRCIEAYEASTGRHTSGMVLAEPDFRFEFDVLKHVRYVAADDAQADPRTAGYVDPYLKPLGITSMLDAVIRVSGRHFGLLCFEHVNVVHHWEQDEIAFACQMGDQIGLALNIAERRHAEQRLQFANALLTTQMETAPDAILVVDAAGRVFSSNRRFRELWGLPAAPEPGEDADAVGERVLSQVETQAQLLADLADIEQHPDREVSDEVRLKDGRVLEVHTSALRLADGTFLGRVWFFRDVTDRKRVEAEVHHRARHDGLTGLPNRAVFKEAVSQAIARARRGDPGFAVLYLDLDHFKDVNDSLGHPAGDELLQQVGERLQGSCRSTDTVARFGGDEFAVIAPGLREPSDAAVLASSILAAFATPFLVQGQHLRTATSIGITVHRTGEAEAEALLSQADLALYRAKADGRGRFRFFTQAMDDEVRTRVALGAELRRAVTSGQLFLVYQPQIDLATGRIVGVEGLVRWAHPTRGVLPPPAFIPIAERNGLIRNVGLFVLTESCRQMRAWQGAGTSPRRMAINLSTLQLTSPLDQQRDLVAVLERTGLPPYSLELEVSEGALTAAVSEQPDMLPRLRERGFGLAVHNFGTGSSSLDALRRFKVDRIKIAPQFVQGIPGDSSSAAIVRATIGLARELNVAVIAEGAETAEQVEHLRAWGCREAQGFYFSEPVSADVMTTMLATRVAPRA